MRVVPSVPAARPGWRLLPAIVGERGLAGAVGIHDEQLAIRLGNVVGEGCFVFEIRHEFN